jgi:succinate dehydrogenase / fumarate reductase membrane anchor subunit
MMIKPGILRSPLGHVRGLGSAKEGTHHWWQQRVTAVALVPLSFWLVYSLLGLSGAGYVEFASWLQNPINATLMVLTVAVLFQHANLGVQVVIEDYVSGHGLRIAAITLVKFTCAALAVLCIVSVLVVAFKG